MMTIMIDDEDQDDDIIMSIAYFNILYFVMPSLLLWRADKYVQWQ